VGGVMGTASLPMRGGFDSMFAGLSEGFVTLIPAKGGPGWTSFIGGGAEDEVRALSISSENRLVLAGMTQSNSALPGSGGHDMTFGGEYDGFIVAVDPDTTPPAAGRVYDRPQSDELHEDLSQQASLTSISANWEGFSDSESGVVEYEWAIGSEASPESTKPFAPVGAATSATALDLPLEGGTSYFVTVRAINGAGLIATARSNGVKVTAPAEEEARYPVGWSCATTVDASLPMLLSVLALALWGRRRGVPARTFRGQ
ncbi:fibronectin type III domain-containing protein, partial [Hyalangium sp.]|uniref:fibronectin type III domain-containing protein n=1 Tax=Hyalangium sp. TaxID=2028555 RepID=UPI002D72C024